MSLNESLQNLSLGNEDTAPMDGRKVGKKRPNQAERRQMAQQMSIPIDAGRAFGQPLPQQRGGFQQYNAPRQTYATRGNFEKQPAAGFPQQPFGLGAQNYGRSDANGSWRGRGGSAQRGLYNPSRGRGGQESGRGGQRSANPDDIHEQATYLERIATSLLSQVEIEPREIAEKERFRLHLEHLCRSAIRELETGSQIPHAFDSNTVTLKCFGSLASGFATKAADMDLGLFSPRSASRPDDADSPIPRLIERVLLDQGIGARLLTNARVPIIKVCEKPTAQLLENLKLVRSRWDTGFSVGCDDDEHGRDGDDSEGMPADQEDDVSHGLEGVEAIYDTQEEPNAVSSTSIQDNNTSSTSRTSFKPKSSNTLDDLRQGSRMKLGSYYNLANRILKQLGGRDITPSNAADFRPEEFEVLHAVCKAFVKGLADQELSTRLQSYPSLQFDQTNIARSTYGVFAQVQGERLVHKLESRPLIEKDERQRQQTYSRIAYWQSLQSRVNLGRDPLADNKEIMSALEVLRKSPAMEMIEIEQQPLETTQQYAVRFTRLARQLTAKEPAMPGEFLEKQLIKSYIDGIRDQKMSSEVWFVPEILNIHSLDRTIRFHMGTQLRADFEIVLGKGAYNNEQAAQVRQYLDVFRSEPDTTTMTWEIGSDPKVLAAYEAIRNMSNPASLVVKQPRDRFESDLEYPKDGVGIHCDINFSAHLGMHNTQLLRCYSQQDPRVRAMVLFVKHWAKARWINTPYRGTLSSYGYVLMVLHFLTNVVRPPICINLQLRPPPPPPNLTREQMTDSVSCQGHNVHFWRDEAEILRLAREGRITQNQESLGLLLRGFFEYYAHSNLLTMGHMRGFDWGRDVLSLRMDGGLLSKQELGWTGAKTTIEIRGSSESSAVTVPVQVDQESFPSLGSPGKQQTVSQPMSSSVTTAAAPDQVKDDINKKIPTIVKKEIRHRYLFAIQDPFESDHNVARTVTHNGIVSIRDEFRRAWRLIQSIRPDGTLPEDLLLDRDAEAKEQMARDKERERREWRILLDEIHGTAPVEAGS